MKTPSPKENKTRVLPCLNEIWEFARNENRRWSWTRFCDGKAASTSTKLFKNKTYCQVDAMKNGWKTGMK